MPERAASSADSRPPPWFAAAIAVAAAYFYFLIFAEFAFIELARRAAAAEHLRPLMSALGAGGVGGAAAAAWRFRRAAAPRQLAIGFLACALTATAALLARSTLTLSLVAALVGFSLGSLTVVLASGLSLWVDARRLGRCVGTGTGLAYAASNMPWLFHAGPVAQTIAAAVAAAAAAAVPTFFPRDQGSLPLVCDSLSRASVLRWCLVLTMLVWMDSAAFYVLQHETVFRSAVWEKTTALLANALVHFLAAVAGGLLLDRGRRRIVVVLAAAALSLGCLQLAGALPGLAFAGFSYAAGVSLYSTVLVEYPARSGRPAVAAFVFAIAGWIGSALGIGMAQDLHAVPLTFVAVAVSVIALAMANPRLTRQTLAVLLPLCLLGQGRGAESDPLVARGREVYIAEGCIHCHSQFIRPRVPADVERWGPAQTLVAARAESPALFGARRQGPDLSHIGNRRSPEWNRLHLIDPAALSPGTRMPSYAHLFRGAPRGESRGDALVSYLSSLGADTFAERQQAIARWQPTGSALPADDAQKLFIRLCASCHGANGRGDGPVAGRLSYPPPDWTKSAWRHAHSAPLELALARIIKFGLPGLAMPGHEYLPDREVLGLVRFVQTLHKSETAAGCGVQP